MRKNGNFFVQQGNYHFLIKIFLLRKKKKEVNLYRLSFSTDNKLMTTILIT